MQHASCISHIIRLAVSLTRPATRRTDPGRIRRSEHWPVAQGLERREGEAMGQASASHMGQAASSERVRGRATGERARCNASRKPPGGGGLRAHAPWARARGTPAVSSHPHPSAALRSGPQPRSAYRRDGGGERVPGGGGNRLGGGEDRAAARPRGEGGRTPAVWEGRAGPISS